MTPPGGAYTLSRWVRRRCKTVHMNRHLRIATDCHWAPCSFLFRRFSGADTRHASVHPRGCPHRPACLDWVKPACHRLLGA